MNTYTLRGVDVQFPHEAYDCQVSLGLLCCLPAKRGSTKQTYITRCEPLQLVYMEKVIQSLQEVRFNKSPAPEVGQSC